MSAHMEGAGRAWHEVLVITDLQQGSAIIKCNKNWITKGL